MAVTRATRYANRIALYTPSRMVIGSRRNGLSPLATRPPFFLPSFLPSFPRFFTPLRFSFCQHFLSSLLCFFAPTNRGKLTLKIIKKERKAKVWHWLYCVQSGQDSMKFSLIKIRAIDVYNLERKDVYTGYTL